MFRLGRLHCVYDTSQTEPDVQANTEEDWADFTYGIEMLNQAVNRGHADAYNLLDETVQKVAAQYENVQDFRHQTARRAAHSDDLCVALHAALDALLVYQQDQDLREVLLQSRLDPSNPRNSRRGSKVNGAVSVSETSRKANMSVNLDASICSTRTA